MMNFDTWKVQKVAGFYLKLWAPVLAQVPLLDLNCAKKFLHPFTNNLEEY